MALLTALHATGGARSRSARTGSSGIRRRDHLGRRAAAGLQDANLTTGTGSTLRLFSSTSDLLAAAGFEGRVAVKVTPTVDARIDVLRETTAEDARHQRSGEQCWRYPVRGRLSSMSSAAD